VAAVGSWVPILSRPTVKNFKFEKSKMAAVLSQQAAAKLPMTLGDIYTFLAAIMSSGEYNANSVDRNASELTLSRQKLV